MTAADDWTIVVDGLKVGIDYPSISISSVVHLAYREQLLLICKLNAVPNGEQEKISSPWLFSECWFE